MIVASGLARAGLHLRTPVLAASGCAGTGRELARFADLDQFGALITRSITTDPRAGLPSPRLAETPSGLINALGLPGPGIDEFVESELPWLVTQGVTVVVSIAAGTPAEFGRLAQRLRQVEGVAGIEVNLSNPAADGVSFAMEPSGAGSIIHAVRRNTAAGVPVLAKLAGDTTDVVATARACVTAGADVLSLINAVRAVGIDTQRARAALGGVHGGLSGPAIRPIALRAVWQVHAALPEVPIVASGGVSTGRDALEMIMAGASAVAIGSALLTDPASGGRVVAELERLVPPGGFDGLIGCAHGRRSHESTT